MAATLVGFEAPARSRNLDVKPYATSSLTTDRTATPRVANDVDGDVGLDVKYGVTQSLTADVTVNTDFAQVEEDEQQVNLTRFSLFFPEKRDFFLEGQGIFGFGGAGEGRNSGTGTCRSCSTRGPHPHLPPNPIHVHKGPAWWRRWQVIAVRVVRGHRNLRDLTTFSGIRDLRSSGAVAESGGFGTQQHR